MSMKKMLVSAGLLVLLSISAFAAGEQGSWTGWVSDAKCGAKVDAACAKKCAEAGQTSNENNRPAESSAR
jgi:hypothetical protein